MWTWILKIFTLGKSTLKSPYTYVILLGGILWAGALTIPKWFDARMQDAYNQGKAAVTNTLNNEALRSYEVRIEESRLEILDLQEKNRQAAGKIRELEKMLLIEHDLDRLLQSKPKMIQKRVNEGTNEVFNDIESITAE